MTIKYVVVVVIHYLIILYNMLLYYITNFVHKLLLEEKFHHILGESFINPANTKFNYLKHFLLLLSVNFSVSILIQELNLKR